MKASISVTTYNRKELSEVAILSIIAHTPKDEYELIVVDNCSDMDTQNMIFKYFQKGYVHKWFVNNWNKHLAVSTNQCFDFADESAEWLIHLDNDDYAMPGWWEHVWRVNNDTVFDYAYGELRGGTCNVPRNIITLPSQGRIQKPHPDIQIGGGLIIKQSTLKRTGIRFNSRWKNNQFGSIYSVLHQDFKEANLTGVELYKPCILFQNCEFNNPKYKDYYDKFFGDRGTMKKLEKKRSIDGYFKTEEEIEEYYDGSDYLYHEGAEANIEMLKNKIGGNI